MNHQLYNDQRNIADGFKLNESYTEQIARLAFFKMNSYKLSLANRPFFNKTRNVLAISLKNTLFNYTTPGIILADIGFFSSEVDN